MFDQCLNHALKTPSDIHQSSQRSTDYGVVSIDVDTETCAIVNVDLVNFTPPFLGHSSEFMARADEWARALDSRFEKSQVVETADGAIILMACLDQTWQVIASISYLDSLANSAVRNHPEWVPETVEEIALALFFVDGQKGNSCVDSLS